MRQAWTDTVCTRDAQLLRDLWLTATGVEKLSHLELARGECQRLAHDFTASTARHTGAIATAIEADTAAATPSDISQPTAIRSMFTLAGGVSFF